MNRIYNFNAGPSTLPLPVLEKAQQELVDFRGRGMSILEMSHRSPEYSEVHSQTVALIRELLGLPEKFKVLFLGGGATMQFSMVPLNLLGDGKSCDLTLTGSWAKKAYADAKKLGKVNLVFDGTDDNFTNLPDPAKLTPSGPAAYLHLTSNETIGGIQWPDFPDYGEIPIVCDMSSDLLSRRLPLEKFGIIYAGAQKNLGPAGVALVIIREDVLDRCSRELPAYLSYRIHAEKDSLYNTPPVFAIYLTGLTLQWLKDSGGLSAAEDMAERRSGLLYSEIRESQGFYRSPVSESCRSKMNVVFRLPTEELEKQFIEEAKQQGMGGLKGHRSVGGCRASLYNAMPVKGAETLADFMRQFAKKNC